MNESLEVKARILGWSTIFGIILASIWYLGYAGGFVVNVSEKLFGLTEHECQLLNYGGIGILKMLVYTFYLIPWIAIRLELHRRKKA